MNGKNKITSQLLAAYAEGKVTPDERTSIRAYLAQHPELLEGVLYMIDDFDYDVALDSENDSTQISGGNFKKMFNSTSAIFPELSMFAAAFAPSATGHLKPFCHNADTSEYDKKSASVLSRIDSLIND